MADSRDILGKNRKFTGTTGIKLPTGTTGQRVNETGQLRFNSSTNLAEYYNGVDWKPIDAPPTITGFTVDGGSAVTSATIGRTSGDATIVIQGSNFDNTSGTVVFEPEGGGSNVTVQTITRTNSSTFTVTVTRTDFLTANDPYAIKLTNGSGLAATLASAITANDAPAFSTAADTNVATMWEGRAAPFSETTLAATDTEGDTITYSISAGALPPGVTINSSTAALEGTVSGSSIQNYTFTVSAATSLGTSTRQFVITVSANPFMAASGGNTTITSGDYKTHIFTSPGTFTVSGAGAPTGSNSVEYLVVAGGAGMPSQNGQGASGGSGAGGYRTNYPSPATGGLSISATGYPITVGGGGAGRTSGDNNAGNGSSSTFSSITSAGGGFGGTRNSNGNPGGSGGGCGSSPNATSAGSGNSPPTSPPQGNPGGLPGGEDPGYPGGGGGGAGASGASPGNNNVAGPGGVGSPIADTFFGPTAPSYGTPGPSPGRYFSGGGGGGNHQGSPAAPGGAGGGGRGGSPGQGVGQGGTTNTGGGGGGTGASEGNPGATGGSGFVAIRYKYQ